MLKRLSISNYLIIDNLEAFFDSGFTVITGATGAGKSIILDALSLIAGKRTSNSVLYDTTKKSIVEAEILIESNKALELMFELYDLDFEEVMLLRREILPSGKSRAFVNDTPVSLQRLKDIMEIILHIHYQHDNFLFLKSEYQLSILDSTEEIKTHLAFYQTLYQEYKQHSEKLSELKQEYAKASNDVEFLKFQLEKINTLALQKGTQSELEKQLELTKNKDAILKSVHQAFQVLGYSENSILNYIIGISKDMQAVSDSSSELLSFSERLKSLEIEVKDLSQEINSYYEGFDNDDVDVNIITERLGAIYELNQRFGVNNSDDLINQAIGFQKKIDYLSELGELINTHEKVVEETHKKAFQKAKVLSKLRKDRSKAMAEEVIGKLKSLGIPDAQLTFEITPEETLSLKGIDKLTILFSANKGMDCQPLSSTASGGELSRVIFVLKVLFITSFKIGTIIFDEIDTGVSGAIADNMGEIMKQVSKSCQTITVSHLPQVAARADVHFRIEKKKNDLGLSFTQMNRLNEEQRIIEIATMLSGKEITQEALANAKQLLNLTS